MLTIEKIEEIKNITKWLQEKSLNEIAEQESIEVVFWDLSEIGDISWAILFIDKKFKIYINSTHSTKRQRFTFAHELGHYFLHRNILEEKSLLVDENKSYLFRKNLYENISKEMQEIEEEANEFAWNLLMPEDKFKELFKQTEWNTLVLSEAFDVSIPAVEYRSYKLKLGTYEYE